MRLALLILMVLISQVLFGPFVWFAAIAWLAIVLFMKMRRLFK